MSTPARRVPAAHSRPASPPADSLAAQEHNARVLRLLEDLLGRVVRRRAPELSGLIEDGWQARDGHLPGGERGLQLAGIWFQLIAIAQEHAAAVRRRSREMEHGRTSVPGTFAAVLHEAERAGVVAERAREIIAGMRVEPTLTAHPTETRRVTVMEIHRRIYLLLLDLDNPRWTEAERETFVEKLHAELDLLWHTGELRLEKPDVEQEVEWGLHFFRETLYQRLPEVDEKLTRAFEYAYGVSVDAEPRPVLRFGSWIGGDRDGHPGVTADVTRHTLFRLRAEALGRYDRQLEALAAQLSVNRHLVDMPEDQAEALKQALGELPDAARARNPNEPFRQLATLMRTRLGGTLAAARAGETPPADGSAYRAPRELERDLLVVGKALAAADCELLASRHVWPLLREVRIFGFRTASLDLRENASETTATLAAVWSLRTGRPAAECPARDGAEWLAWLREELATPGATVTPDELPAEVRAPLELLRTLRGLRGAIDHDAVSRYVLSMTAHAADVLGVYLLAKYAALFTDPDGMESATLQVVPLFESIDDLERAPAVMTDLLGTPVVRRTVRECGGAQEVMIGYSDSNKDGGFLAANHALSHAQAKLTEVGRKAGVPIRFFHGRGGSVGRGGVHAARAIAAQPAGSVGGRLRVTEQGEVATAKYANRGTAGYHLELLAASVLEHTLKSEQETALAPNPEFDEALSALAGLSHTAWRQLVETPGLPDYFAQASPVEELALMNIGSRPARRKAQRDLASLRAIPWVFAWSQNRHMLPGWYGVGSAIEAFLEVRGDDGRELLARMFEGSRLFRLVADEAEKTLATVDLALAREYAGLVEDEALRDAVFVKVKEEYDRTRRALLALGGGEKPGERFPRFMRRLDRRLPVLAAVGRKQVALLGEFRAAASDAERKKLALPLRLSINCVAGGLGWTG